MQWLQQNWLLVLFGVGLIFMFTRHGGMGCGMGGGSRRSGHDHGARRDHDDAGPYPQASMNDQAVDPVSGRPVDPATAVSAMHRGAPVYFESRANRDRFEATPDQFSVAAPPHQHRHGGC